MKAKLKRIVSALCLMLGLLLVAPWQRTSFALDSQKPIQLYKHDSWQTENGLPQNPVNQIVQTRDGYLWLGTMEGLVRFDGVRFTVFDNNNTKEIKTPITALLEGCDGSLWIGTAGGLTRLKDGRFDVYTTDDGLSSDRITRLFEDRNGYLWIGTHDAGLNRLKDGSFVRYTTKDGLSSNRITSICGDRNGNLWVATDIKLHNFRNGEFKTYTTKNGLTDDRVISIREDHQGVVWFGTADANLNGFQDGKFTHLPPAAYWIVSCIYADKSGNFWIGASGALLLLKDGVLSRYPLGFSDIVVSLYEDREGSLWVGTDHSGLHRFVNPKFTFYTTQEGVPASYVNSVCEDHQGRLWISTEDGGIAQFVDGLFHPVNQPAVPRRTAQALYASRDGGVWANIDGHLYKFKDARFRDYSKEMPLYAWSMFEDVDGVLWIGTTTGLVRFKQRIIGTYTKKDGLADDRPTVMYQDAEGSIWIGTVNGLNRFRDGKFTTFTTKDGLASNNINSIQEDNESNLWIGTTYGGLGRYKSGKFSAYTSKDGLFSDVVYQVLDDQRGSLWMSSNKGISRVNKKDLDDFDHGQIKLIPSIPYDQADGLKSTQFSGKWFQPAGWKTSDGKLWFATDKGVVSIDPNRLTKNELVPPVAIEEAIIDKKAMDTHRSAIWAPGVRDIELHYTALSLAAAEKVKFKYQLEEYDEDWIDAGTRRVAYYTNLTPGHYRFRVIACNNDGVWNETGATFEFYLQPHFYQTGWFYALCGVAAIFTGVVLYRLRLRQLRRRTLELEEIVDERTAALKREQQKVLVLEKQATEQQMAGGFAHEMRNALAGPKLVLDQVLGLGGPEQQPSLNLANCRSLKEIYLGLKDKLPAGDVHVILDKMQTIFTNEERLNETLELVSKATTRGLNITQQIMDYSKMGQQLPGHHPINLDDLIVNIINESQDEFSAQGITVEYPSNHAPIYIACDETHFYSIIKNLILNARDALLHADFKGGENRRIEITSELADQVCSLVVVDNGIGIAKENLSKIFEPFFSTKPASGTGLGLGMVKKMISLYGGTIDISSEVGRGTKVTISLPVGTQVKDSGIT